MARTIFIGDIHGCYLELLDLLEKVGINEDDTLISLGDVVDRGPDSGKVIEFFRQRPKSLVLCGNHERKHIREVLTYGQEIVKLQLGKDYQEAVAWMNTLPYWYEDEQIKAVHAAVVPGMALKDSPPEILSGTTSGEEKLKNQLGGCWWTEVYTEDKPVVFGHHVVGAEPKVFNERAFGIDTGACHGQSLTALVLPTFSLVSVPARDNHWKITQKRWQLPVLASRPWSTMSFEQIQKKAGELGGRHPDAVAWLQGVQAWAEALQKQLPVLAEAVEAEAQALKEKAGERFHQEASQHPAGTILIRWAAGRLSRDHLGCASPADVFALADSLGIALSLSRSPVA